MLEVVTSGIGGALVGIEQLRALGRDLPRVGQLVGAPIVGVLVRKDHHANRFIFYEQWGVKCSAETILIDSDLRDKITGQGVLNRDNIL
jgi:hypothetical protein